MFSSGMFKESAQAKVALSDIESTVLENRFAFVEKGVHAFVRVVAGEAGMQFAAFKQDAFGQSALVRSVDGFLDGHKCGQ